MLNSFADFLMTVLLRGKYLTSLFENVEFRSVLTQVLFFHAKILKVEFSLSTANFGWAHLRVSQISIHESTNFSNEYLILFIFQLAN